MSDDPRDYKASTRLPTTAFPMKANLAQREPEQLARWTETKLYERLVAAAKGTPFVLHDGPPYANGHLHEGHFLNRTLKDIVVKTMLMEGRPTDYIPGWDCHGLPIELAVDRELGKELAARSSKLRELDKLTIRRACRAHAQKFLDIQRDEMKRLGILARWDAPYATMAFGYEAQIVRELSRVVRAGAVYRGKKPVYWCWNDRTALAEAEIEYQDDPGPSVYVGFSADESSADALAKLIPAVSRSGGRPARFAIWTTTPWTLPANLAIAANPDFVYVAYELARQATIVAAICFAIPRRSRTRGAAGEQREIAGRELRRRHAPPTPSASSATSTEARSRAWATAIPFSIAPPRSFWPTTSPSRPALASCTPHRATARTTTRWGRSITSTSSSPSTTPGC